MVWTEVTTQAEGPHSPTENSTGHQRARNRKPAQARFQSAWKTVVLSYQEEDELSESVVFQSLS